MMDVLLIANISCKKETQNVMPADTLNVIPTVTTPAITYITVNSASSGGIVTADGGSEVISRGVCWNNAANPTTADSKTIDGTGTGSFSSNITGLTANTTYYVRAYAINSAGTGYGNQTIFKTRIIVTPLIFNANLTYGTVSDIDNNVYKTIQIGTQVWIAENLKTTRFNDGSAIPLVSEDTAWSNLSSPGYCWPDNQIVNKDTYGALYNWYTVNTTKLCPTGWHVPTLAQWNTLTSFLNENVAGDKLKESGSSHWLSPNSGTNESGFTAVPAGTRRSYGLFRFTLHFGYWWSSSEANVSDAWGGDLQHDFSDLYRDIYNKQYGFSVRCIKD
jgi:uncharacterized protein (TIGR02145 family)